MISTIVIEAALLVSATIFLLTGALEPAVTCAASSLVIQAITIKDHSEK